MYIIKELEKEFLSGDSGPKYLMKGPRMNLSFMQFNPGDEFIAHYHNIMEENLYIIEGEINIVVDGIVHHLEQGDFIHIEPSEVHYCFNPYQQKVRMISIMAPFQEADEVEVKNYTY